MVYARIFVWKQIEQLLSNYVLALAKRFRQKKHFCMKNASVKCWWNWHQGSISPTCLRAAFTCPHPESAQKTVKSSVHFLLLGSVCLKAARKTLVKLIPGITKCLLVPTILCHCSQYTFLLMIFWVTYLKLLYLLLPIYLPALTIIWLEKHESICSFNYPRLTNNCFRTEFSR